MANAPFVVQPQLTAITLAYRNQALIADRVLPRYPVNATTFKYSTFTKEDGFTVPDTRVGRKSQVNEIDWSATEQSTSVLDYGLEDAIPNADILQAQSVQKVTGVTVVNPLDRSTELLTDLVALDRESRVASLVFNTSSYASANKVTLSGTSQWSDYTNSNPVDAILAAQDGLLVRPNTLVLGRAVWTKLRQHPKVVNAYYGNQANAGAVPLQAFSDLVEIPNVLIGESWINTAKKGQTATISRLWGKNALMYYQAPIPTGPTGGLTFGLTGEWGTRVAGTIADDPDIGLRGGTRVRVGESLKELILAADIAYYFNAAVA